MKSLPCLRSIGLRLRRARQAKALTQERVAGLARVSQVALSRIEHGRLKSVEYETLRAISAAIENADEPLRAYRISVRDYPETSSVFRATSKGRARTKALRAFRRSPEFEGISYRDLRTLRAPDQDPDVLYAPDLSSKR